MLKLISTSEIIEVLILCHAKKPTIFLDRGKGA
jgi:hypothetical protein